MGPSLGVADGDLVQLDVEELVDGLEHAGDAEVVLELDGDLVVDEGFEETRRGLGIVLDREFTSSRT